MDNKLFEDVENVVVVVTQTAFCCLDGDPVFTFDHLYLVTLCSGVLLLCARLATHFSVAHSFIRSLYGL